MRLAQHPWTDAEIEQVAEMWDRGATASTIADALGPHRTRNSVMGKVRRLGLADRPSPIAHVEPRPWTDGETAALRGLYARGMRPAAIARELKRTGPSVASKLERLTNAKPKTSKPPEPKQLPPDPQTLRDREPCPRCQVRGDMGCAHRPAGEQPPKLTSRA